MASKAHSILRAAGSVALAFPTIAAQATTSAATGGAINLPSGIGSGSLVGIFVLVNDPLASAPPANFTELRDDAEGANHRVNISYKFCTGSEGATVTTNWEQNMCAIAYRFAGHHASTPPEVTTGATATSTAPDPGSLTPSWGSAANLWLPICATLGDVTTYPTNYTNGLTIAGSGDTFEIAAARRQLAAASEDPGAYALSVSALWRAYTFAVRPA